MFAPRNSCLATMYTIVYFIEDVTLTAFRCAGYLLATKTRKKNEKVKPKDSEADHDDIPFLMKDIVVLLFVSLIICGAYQRGEKVEDVCTDDANPIIVRVIDADEDIEARYAIVIENQSVLTCCHLLSALFTLFGSTLRV